MLAHFLLPTHHSSLEGSLPAGSLRAGLQRSLEKFIEKLLGSILQDSGKQWPGGEEVAVLGNVTFQTTTQSTRHPNMQQNEGPLAYKRSEILMVIYVAWLGHNAQLNPFDFNMKMPARTNRERWRSAMANVRKNSKTVLLKTNSTTTQVEGVSQNMQV